MKTHRTRLPCLAIFANKPTMSFTITVHIEQSCITVLAAKIILHYENFVSNTK